MLPVTREGARKGKAKRRPSGSGWQRLRHSPLVGSCSDKVLEYDLASRVLGVVFDRVDPDGWLVARAVTEHQSDTRQLLFGRARARQRA